MKKHKTLCPLTPKECSELEAFEQLIRESIKDSLKVGYALLQIKTQHLHRQIHKSFAAYVNERFGMSRGYAYKLIDAASVRLDIQEMSPNGDIRLPDSEAQAREIARFKTKQQRFQAWQQVLKTTGDETLTANAIRKALLEPEEAKISPNNSKQKARQCINRLRTHLAGAGLKESTDEWLRCLEKCLGESKTDTNITEENREKSMQPAGHLAMQSFRDDALHKHIGTLVPIPKAIAQLL